MPRAKGGSIPPPRVVIHPGHGGSIADLNENDVLSGRGGRINNHPGNITFRTIVEDYKREYLDPRTRKLEKAHVAARLVAQIRSTNPPGRFLREDPDNPGKYVEIGDQKAWKKAGQALREDAPDVRKELDEEIDTKDVPLKEAPKAPGHNYATPPPKQHTRYFQPRPHHPHQYRPGVPSGLPPGIPPSVSYSPTSAPMPLKAGGGPRPDPPEAEGVTGYRQPPLRYLDSGRGPGRGGVSGRGPPPGRGRGPPPPHHHHPQQFPGHPPQQGYHHQNYYNHPPQPGPPHSQHYPPGPQYQQHPQHGPPPQFQQQPYHHHPQQYPPQGHPNQPPPPGHKNGPQPPPGPQPQPQFAAPQDKSKKKSSVPTVPAIVAPAAIAVANGVQQTMDSVKDLTNKVTKRRPPANMKGSTESEFPPHMSVATDFTMSDVSAIGDSRIGFDESMKGSIPTPGPEKRQQAQAPQGGADPFPVSREGEDIAPLKQSTETRNSSSDKSESFTMSDLMGSNFSLGLSRTRSFPDLMLSTGDLLPPLQNEDAGESDREEKDQRRFSSRNAALRTQVPFNRQSSSESSEIGGFHPVRGRTNTGNLSNLNDAMSIMSLDSRKSMRSENSSWLDNFRSMQSIHSDMNPWEAGGSAVKNQMMNDGTDGSVRSFLSDVSNELNALDLAEPLLPPLDSGLNDSNGESMVVGIDP